MEFLKKELLYFQTALMFFTRIPVMKELPYSKEIMNQSQKYFPWVGLVVGGFTALVFYFGQLLFGLEIGIILSMIFSVLLTGAFHEDGFTDVCDSFGGGYGHENIMKIMKDSRIGAYGTIGIILLLLLKFLSIKELEKSDLNFVLFSIIAAHTVSRFFAVTMIYSHQYVNDTDTSKSKPLANQALSYSALGLAFVAVLIPFIIYQDWKFFLALPICFLGKVYLGWYFKKHLGGYTGDCLGTVQQVCEVLFYLSCLLIWKFI